MIQKGHFDNYRFADYLYFYCSKRFTHQYLKEEGKKEVAQITCEKFGKRIYDVYQQLI